MASYHTTKSLAHESAENELGGKGLGLKDTRTNQEGPSVVQVREGVMGT